MRILAIVFCLILWSLSSALRAQENLIPDPGFEDWDSENPYYGGGLSDLFLWFDGNGSPDHHNIHKNGVNLTGIDTTCAIGTGRDDCGFPFKGESVLGCWRGNGRTGSKEWARTEMIKPMEEGSCYKVSFWIENKKDRLVVIDTITNETEWRRMACNQWGAFFNVGPVLGFSPNYYDFTTIEHQYVHMDSVLYSPGWQYQEWIFHADQPYTHAYLGYVGRWDLGIDDIYNVNGQLGPYVWIDEFYVTKIPPPIIFGGLADSIVCLSDSILLTAKSDTLYSWSFNGLDLNTDSLWFKADAPGYYTFTASSKWSEDCLLSSDITLFVPEIRVEALSYSADTLDCPLEGVCHGVLELSFDGGKAPYYTLWPGEEVSSDSMKNALCNGNNCVLISESSGCPTDVNWCIDLDLPERQYAKAGIQFPNVISPNNDGENDVFRAAIWNEDGSVSEITQEIIDAGLLYDFHVSVLNRWGQIVFESSDPLAAWSADNVAGGTYYFVMTYKDACAGDAELESSDALMVIK